MKKTLKQLGADILAADELARKAREDYEKGALELLRDGKLVEKEIGRWNEVVSERGRRVYCSLCRAVFGAEKINPYNSFCPACGASMVNANRLYDHEPEREEAAAQVKPPEKVKLSCADENPNGEHTSKDIVDFAKRRDISKGIIAAFTAEGIHQKGLCALSGIKTSSMSNYANGKAVPKDGAYYALCDAYKDYFGRDFLLK